ncbi:MAG: hypothetical protein RMK29_17605 [Myxococcales bacterium]|nr:hypothetical protein [Myxococcota bacterium]MDW8283527.1 hypothetical protein [Myxococcales bacterium]
MRSCSPAPELHRAQGLLTGAAEAMQLGHHHPSESDIAAVNRDYGRDLPAFAQAAASALCACPEAYTGLSCTAQSIQAKEARLRMLLEFKDSLDLLASQVGREIHALRIGLARDVTQVIQASEAIQLHPGGDEALKKRVRLGTQRLLSLRQGRRAAARSAAETTRAHSEKLAEVRNEKDARISSLEAENAELRLTNQLLGGGELRPEDIAPPPPAAQPARQGRRRGRSLRRA